MREQTSVGHPARIIHVARSPQTGVVACMKTLVEAQLASGVDARIVLLLPQTVPIPKCLRDVTVVRFWTPPIFGTAAFLFHEAASFVTPGWRRVLASGKRPTLVHHHNAWLAGALASGVRGRAAQVVTFHGVAAEHALARQPARRWIHSRWARRAERLCEALVAVDGATVQRAAGLFGIHESRFRVVRNGVTPPPREHTGREAGRLRVGHVGVVDEGKGWRLAAEAVDRLRAGGEVDITFTLVGSGPEADDAATWCAARSHCDFRGWVEDPRVSVFPCIDVLVLASRSEGTPMAVLEALSAGVPVVCTRVGGMPEIIHHESNGLLVDRTVEALEAALIRLRKDDALWQRLARGARDSWYKAFSAKHMSANYEMAYADALACGEARP